MNIANSNKEMVINIFGHTEKFAKTLLNIHIMRCLSTNLWVRVASQNDGSGFGRVMNIQQKWMDYKQIVDWPI